MTTEVRKLTQKDLKEIVKDGAELAKGAAIFTEGGLKHLARFEHKLFCEAAGSGASPYKVQVLLEESVKGRCGCMAARSRPFCKHSAGLLVAWASTPDAFAVSTEPPAGATGGRGDNKKTETKKSKVDPKELLKKGTEQVLALVGELGTAGTAALGGDRSASVRALADSLREHRLRRLSAKSIELADLLDAAQNSSGEPIDALAWADLLCDLQLSARRIEKHVGGDLLEDKYVEELIGKSWTKKDRAPVSGLDLVEVSYSARTTSDEFRVVESRFVDAATGEHYSEKQILPSFLARRTDAKKTHSGKVLKGAAGSRYPGFAPYRLDLESEGAPQPLEASTVDALIACALPSVTDALAKLQERKKDVFAPDLMPVLVRADTLLAEGERLRLVDDKGEALLFPFHRALFERIASALRGVKLLGVVGDVLMDRALATLHPLAFFVDDNGRRLLMPLAHTDPAALNSKRALAAATGSAGKARRTWIDVARRAGVSSAAIALGEAREELAYALTNGLAGFTARAAEPIAQRLKDLGLERPATVLVEAAQKPDARDRLDDVVKIHQVTGIALSRLAATAPVDRSTLMSAPTWEGVKVRRNDEVLTPPAIAARVSRGEINRFEAAVLYDRFYRALPVEELAERIYPTWADGSASEFVARVFASQGDVAQKAAERALAVPEKAAAWMRAPARIARITGVRVLQALKSDAAVAALVHVADNDHDPTVKAWARRALLQLGKKPSVLTVDNGVKREDLRAAVIGAPTFDERASAAHELARRGDLDAIPVLRAAMDADASSKGREAAALALAQLGDVESFDRFLEMLSRREEDNEDGKLGAYCLGALGDIRGVDALLEAYATGWQPQIVMEAIRQIGPAALDALIAFLEDRPELAKRVSTRNVIKAMAPDEVVQLLSVRLDQIREDEKFVERAKVLLDMSNSVELVEKAIAMKVLALRPDLEEGDAFEGDAKKEARALFRKCKHVVEPPPKKAGKAKGAA